MLRFIARNSFAISNISSSHTADLIEFELRRKTPKLRRVDLLIHSINYEIIIINKCALSTTSDLHRYLCPVSSLALPPALVRLVTLGPEPS